MQEAFTSTKQWVPEMEGGAYGEGYGFVQSGGRVESIMPDSRITILFDLNGVLLAEPTPTQQRSATARRAKKRRRGLSHIVRLRQHFRLGVYTSATLPTTNRVLQAMKSDLLHLHQGWKEWLTQRGGLFELVLFREHCRPAAEHVCRRLGKPWHTCKPLALHGLDLRRTLLVDDSPSKALDESELGNMLVLPTFQCEGAPPSDLFLFHLAELLLRTLAGYQGDVRLALAKQLQPHVPRLAAAAAPPAGPLTAALPLSGEWHWWRPNDAASADPRSVECFPRQPQASPRHPQPRSPVAAAAIPARQPAAAPAAAEPEWPRAVQAECVGAGTEAGPDGSELNSAAAGSRGKQGKHLERGFYLLKEGDEALDRHIAVLFGAALREVGRERGMPVRLLPTAMQHLLRRREWARHREHLWPAGVQLDELQPCLDYSTQQWFAPTALNGQAWLVLKRGVDPRAAWRKQLPQDLCPGSEAMRAAREQSIACCLQVMAGFAAPCDAADLLMAVLPQGCAARQSVASCRRWDPSGGGGGGGSAGGPKACGKGAAQYEGMTARFRHVVTLLQQPAPPGRQALVATDDVLRSGQGRDLVRVRLGPPAAAVQLALLALSDGFPSADADPAVLAQCRSCSFGAAAAELCSGRRGIGPWVQLGAPTARPDGDSPMAPGASPGGCIGC